MDFDDLDDAEEAEAGRIEDATLAAEEANHFSARLDSFAIFRAKPSADAPAVGERQAGALLRLVKRSDDGAWALLHPLELSREALDYQDYWSAAVAGRLPRQGEAWLPSAQLTPEPVVAECLAPQETTDEEARLLERPPGDADSESIRAAQATLTVIVSTSPAEHHCLPATMLHILRSLQANVVLAGCRKVIVFDALPSAGEARWAEESGALAESGGRWVPRETASLAERYEAYCCALEEAQDSGDPAMSGVELLRLPEWGHLVGTVRYALDRINTPFVLLHQHDLLLSRNFSATHAIAILRALARRSANYVILNRDVNLASRSTAYFQVAPHQPDAWRAFSRRHRLSLDDALGTELTPFIGFSDQTHFARADWVRDRVLPGVGPRKCCMEFAFYEVLLRAWLHDQGSWERTYMMGGMTDGPYIYDMEKNGVCWAEAEDAYSEEKVDECSISADDRIVLADRCNRCLALYVVEPSDPSKSRMPGRICYFPNPTVQQDMASISRFCPGQAGLSTAFRGVNLGGR